MNKDKDISDLNEDEKQADETIAKRVTPDLISDTFSKEESKKIVEMVMDDLEIGLEAQRDWLEVKKKELQHIHSAKPSEIENIPKRSWMSDRNLGLMAGILDIYQATLLSTCYNPDSIHFVAGEDNDVNNRDSLSKFVKWGLGKSEANSFPEVDDFIANRVSHGFSAFKVYWEVKYMWIDKRIPKYSKIVGKENHIIGYNIKTEKRRFERGVIKNIANIDDMILPSYGGNIQELDFVIENLHISYNDLCDMADIKAIMNFEKEEFKKQYASMANTLPDNIRNKKMTLLKLSESMNKDLKNMPVECFEWYGFYEKDGRKEKYRFLIEPVTQTLLSGKPLRKINRDGLVPYVAGPLRRIPGFLRGGSLIMLISNLINALNNNYNQTSDFQYIQNMPFGFANLTELRGKAVYELEPGIIYNVDDSPINEKVFFPNLSRSLAWSYQDKEFLMQMIERLTGAASYFLTTDTKEATATRDSIINEKGETKFGLWVKRIMVDICEAINMWVSLYQENAPRNLAQRVIGKEGKRLFKSLSIDDLRGKYDAYMVPDITHGSKVFEKQVKLWGLGLLGQSIWFAPQLNPRGNWMITNEAMKSVGYPDADKYMPPMPKADVGSSEEVENEFIQMMQGDVPNPPPEGVTPLVMEHLAGHQKQREERYNEIPEEYRPNFDAHLFATIVNYMDYIRQRQMEQVANQIAVNAVNRIRQVGAEVESPTNIQPPVKPEVPMQPVQPAQPSAPAQPGSLAI